MRSSVWAPWARRVVRDSASLFSKSLLFSGSAAFGDGKRGFMVVALRMIRSPTRQPDAGQESVTDVAPTLAVSPSLIQVRLSGVTWKSMRPPQEAMGVHDPLFMRSI